MQTPRDLTTRERDDWSRGRASFERGDLDEAQRRLGRLVETRGEFADVHYMLGVLQERRGDLDGAVKSLETAVALNPRYAEAILALASVHEQRHDFDRARELGLRLREIAAPAREVEPIPAPPERALGRPGRALDPLTQGKLANLQAALGDAYREAGELRDAIDAYRRALDRCPDFHDIRHRLGVALREAGLPAQAIAELRRVLRACPDHLTSAVQLGLAYYGLGRSEEATREWAAVLARDPAREDARIYLRMVRTRGEESDAG